MHVLQPKKLYLPAVSILTVVLLLLILIGISTYRNIDREEQTTLKFVHQQGLTMIKALEAGSRTGMMMPMWREDSIGSLIQETGKSEDIAYIYLIDTDGKVAHHSNPSLEGMFSAWQPQVTSDSQVQNRIKKLANGVQVYDLAKRFSPVAPQRVYENSNMSNHGDYMVPHQHPGSIIVLGMKMTLFEAARRSDIHHAVIMAAILIILGSGALFFIFVIQNYYLVNKTLKQTRDYTRQVVANMANGLLSTDLEGKIVSYNLLALELLGIHESEVGSVNLKSNIGLGLTCIDDILSGGLSITEREISHRHRSGDRVPISISATPILDEGGQCTGTVIVLRDLREIKHLEERVRHSEKLAAVGRLAAGVAHEIRNPLSSIRGFSRFLAHSQSVPLQEKEYAGIIVKEVDRIGGVVNDLLTFARPLEPELTFADVAELIKHTVRLVEADARSRNVRIKTNIDPDLQKLPLDANQITQALLNLILNALHDADAQGEIEIGARMNELENRFYIWVEDDGPGIPSDERKKIFDPFYTTRETGTGLGLAIVHKIVENHGGDIMLESPLSDMDRGCRFTIVIPLRSKEGRQNRPS
jgi:two-component system sensor histidine kinase HydH